MMYRFRALGPLGGIVRGVRCADGPDALERSLRDNELELLSWRASRLSDRYYAKLSRRELIDFAFQLEQLLHAGVPMADALQDISALEPAGKIGLAVASLREAVGNGKTLSQAMQDSPWFFNDIAVGLIAAGELSGRLSDVLADWRETLLHQERFFMQSRKALFYPGMVALMTGLATAVLMAVTVPALKSFVQQSGGQLPWHSRALFLCSDIASQHGLAILACASAVVLVIGGAYRRSHTFALAADRLALQLPVLGPVLSMLAWGRALETLRVLYTSGLPLLDALSRLPGLSGNRAVDQALSRIARNVTEGHSLAGSFRLAGLPLPMVVRIIGIGEASGSLDRALRHLCDFFQRRTQEYLERLHALIEPTLTIALGLILGWVVMSIVGPLYDALLGMRR